MHRNFPILSRCGNLPHRIDGPCNPRNRWSFVFPTTNHRDMCRKVPPPALAPTTITTQETPTYNQVQIQMLSRQFQRSLFGCEIKAYPPAPKNVMSELTKHGIRLDRTQSGHSPVNFPLPEMQGSNIAEHMGHISDQLFAPYGRLLQSFQTTIPQMPTQWSNQTGWTRYSWVSPHLFGDESTGKENYGSLDRLIPLYATDDTSGKKCVIGHFVSYDRARLMEEYRPYGTGTRFVDTLSLHVAVSGLTSTQRHLKATALKNNFNNKLWKTYMKDHGDGVKNKSPQVDGENQMSHMDLQWISETSLNKLTDVYRLYCEKDPPQDKQARSVFESGTRREVQAQFQELMRYCATDVLMTFEVFQKLLPMFQERFPHAASLYGLLEMGSMYLPINSSWNTFQQRAQTAFTENELRQKRLLMQLAEQALQRYTDPSKDPRNDPWLWDLDWSKPKTASKKTEAEKQLATLPKWYRELIPKPMKSNVDAGPALVTAQMRIAPKLLRLCWRGMPLHYDQVLKWGVLIPGRAPQPYGDPRFYTDGTADDHVSLLEETNTSDSNMTTKDASESSSSQYRVRCTIPVIKQSAAGAVDFQFPYKSYLSFWLDAMRDQLLAEVDTTHKNPDTNVAAAYAKRTAPDVQDDRLLAELQRSVEAMPLEREERRRLSHSIRIIRKLGATGQARMMSTRLATTPAHEKLGEMQARGPAFWLDANRHHISTSSSNPSAARSSRGRQAVRQAVDTINPVIPTCWFSHLPHEAGEGLPVGSPLSRSFQAHIATNRLHIARTPNSQCPTSTNEDHAGDSKVQTDLERDSAGLANQLLRDRVHASFWQSYSKRIKEQMAIWSPPLTLSPEIKRDSRYDPEEKYGAILPQVIASGTVSRRAVEPLWLTASNADRNRLGSEIKAMVQAPPGFCFVGADVDSQEMWIASLIGDASVGFQGATPYGWMTLEGNKSDGTDLHTKIAHIMGITRNEAKVLNYARLYGSGFEFTKHLLTKFSNITPEQASLKAKELIRTTKGQRNGTSASRYSRSGNQKKIKTATAVEDEEEAMASNRWHGGTESAVFNQLEHIARSSEPRTPFLRGQLTRALNPKLVKEDFLPSRINWVVQSSAVDYLHSMLIVMSWLIEKYQLPARLCISIHDEVRYMCREDAAPRVAMALQISNLFARAFFAYQVGMRDLPESVAFFSSVEIDSCLRKSPTDDCVTPSNPEGVSKTYGIQSGQSLTIREILDKTGGHVVA